MRCLKWPVKRFELTFRAATCWLMLAVAGCTGLRSPGANPSAALPDGSAGPPRQTASAVELPVVGDRPANAPPSEGKSSEIELASHSAAESKLELTQNVTPAEPDPLKVPAPVSNLPADTESPADMATASPPRPDAARLAAEGFLPPRPNEDFNRPVYAVDLLTALRLADAQNLTIAIARNRLEVAYAVESRADMLWLPDIEFSPSYIQNAGRVQRAIGEIIKTRRNSLRVRGGPVLSVDAAEAIYRPLVTHQEVHARAAGINVARNNSLAEVAGAYFDLLASFSAVAIAIETREHAERLATLTDEMAAAGLGLTSDAARAETELQIRRQLETLSRAQIVTTSANLARRLQIDPRLQFVPVEPMIVPLTIIPSETPAEGLVDLALENRPEMAEHRALVDAASWSAEQARMMPFIPQLVLGFQPGGFGGGYTGDPQGFFGEFGSRNDFEATAVWQLTNLGFGNLYQIRQREWEVNGQQLALRQTMYKVMEEVVTDHQIASARWLQLASARLGVEAALDSYNQNITRIEGGAGLPIEALQSLQALQKARTDYLDAVTYYNRAQFQLFAALGYAGVDAAPSADGSASSG